MKKVCLMLMAIATLGVLALPAAASAKPWNCEASVLDLGVGPQPPQSPITANAAQSECKNATAGGTGPSLAPLPVSGNLLSARTTITPSTGAPATQKVTATGEIGSLSIGPTGSLPGLPAPPAIPPGQTVPTPVGPLDITAALQALANAPNVELLGVKLASATASAQCAGGKPVYSGSAKVASLTMLGQELPAPSIPRR